MGDDDRVTVRLLEPAGFIARANAAKAGAGALTRPATGPSPATGPAAQ